MIVTFDCPFCGADIRGKLTDEQKHAECGACGKESPIPFVGIVPGVVLGDCYRIDEKVSEGAGGTEYIGYQETVQRKVCVKLLPGIMTDDEETVQRFLREVKVMASLQHPNIVSAYHAGADCGTYFLVTQYVEGRTLAQRLAGKGRFEEKTAIRLLLPIAAALQYVWNERKILHRNVKPENVIITPEGLPKLLDFGIAKPTGDDAMSLTGAGLTLGTPEYMSPEQVMGEASLDFRSDMYSLGIVLYEALAGAPPFVDASPILVMNKQMDAPPPPLAAAGLGVSDACSALVDHMLRKAKDERPADWAGVIGSMEALLSTPSAPPPARKKKRAAAAAPPKKARAAVAHKSAADQPRTAAKKAGGRRGVDPQDVRRIAAEMYRKPSASRTLLVYVLSAAVPILAFVFYQKSRHAAPEPAPPATGASTDSRDRQLHEMFDYARHFAETHPGRRDEALRKFAAVKEQSKGTKYFLMADEAMARLRALPASPGQ